MKVARVVVTLACNRKCKGCVNTQDTFNLHKSLESIDDLLKYDSVIITGGEPMLIPQKIIDFINTLKKKGYKGKIYMYTAYYKTQDSLYAKQFETILSLVDGITYTLHNEATDKDIVALRELSSNGMLGRRSLNKVHRLSIDSRLYERYDFSNIYLNQWAVIRKLQWLEECPLPENEDLYLYQL